MSVYKPKKSPFYAYDFQCAGRRFCGSTRCTTRRDAESFERAERERVARDIRLEGAAGAAPLTLDLALDRYWIEVGQHHAAAETTWTNLERLQTYFGSRRLDEINDDDVAKLVAWRRAQTVRGRKTVRDPSDPDRTRKIAAPRIAAATVNRSTIEPLQKICTRARTVWKIALPHEPDWKRHILKEPDERVREVRRHEESTLDAIPPDYRPLVDFARASGLRLTSCLLRKDEVDLHGDRIRTIGKGKKIISQPISSEMRAILMAAMANPTDHVFTYAAKRTKRGPGHHACGQRLPITASGLKTIWRRARAAGLPADLRFHDLRHDFATKLLRETGNLKLVQKALHHAKIETTTRYAHVLDEEVLAGMEAAARRR